ncbi:hypothetical protein evm_014773 [Chilo suppressalis]|nr:hypothetical protein evm_014773 [Chilo suppressalis]
MVGLRDSVRADSSEMSNTKNVGSKYLRVLNEFRGGVACSGTAKPQCSGLTEEVGLPVPHEHKYEYYHDDAVPANCGMGAYNEEVSLP